MLVNREGSFIGMLVHRKISKQPLFLPGGRRLDFSGPALVMAVVNCNEDSFYPASRAAGKEAVERALEAEEEGASIIDFGGESTRPGSSYIDEEEELRRVIPAIKDFRKRSSLPVSVDTRKARVARAALDEGADIINDISGLDDDPDMARLCADSGAAVVLVHKKGLPLTMQEEPVYTNLFDELADFFRAAVERACGAGISAGRIILDPGFGFGKTVANNLEILRRIVYGAGASCDMSNACDAGITCNAGAALNGTAAKAKPFPRLAEICGKEYPLLIGLSRKQFIGELTGRDLQGRLAGTLAANGAAILGGADIIRVHDVGEHVDLAKVLFALRPED